MYVCVLYCTQDELRVYYQLRNYVNLKIQADYQDNVSHFAEMASKYEYTIQNTLTHLFIYTVCYFSGHHKLVRLVTGLQNIYGV